MTSLEHPGSPSRPAVNPWLIAVAVTVPTFMEVLDCLITNVALRFIAGDLSAAENDSEWIITSYLSANAIILPLSGWLSAYLGRRRDSLSRLARPLVISPSPRSRTVRLAAVLGPPAPPGTAGRGARPRTPPGPAGRSGH